MTLFSLCAFALLTGVILKIAEEFFPKFKPLILSGAGVLFFLYFFQRFSPIHQKLVSFVNGAGGNGLFSLLFKGFGIAVLVAVSASFCRDLGEEKVAEKLELCGKAAVLYLSLPLLEQILQWIGGLIL